MSDELLILTAEQSILEDARAACLQDMQGRTTSFLTTVSGTLVALSFLGAASHFGHSFVVFTITLLLFLWIIGMLSFGRIAQIGVEDEIIASGMARIRHRYTELVRSLEDLYAPTVTYDAAAIRRKMGGINRWLQAMLPIQALVSFVVSAVGGCEIAVGLSLVMQAPFAEAIAGGAIAFALNVLALTGLSAKILMSAESRAPALFPASRRRR